MTSQMHERPTAIVYLVPGFPSGSDDSSCVPPIRNLITEIAARNPEREVHVVAFQYPFEAATYKLDGVTVRALAGANRRGPFRWLVWLRALRYVWGLARRTRIEVLHSFWLTECAWVGERMSQLLELPHLATIAGQDARPDNPYLRFLAAGRLRVTAGSDFAADHFHSATGHCVVEVVPIGLDEVDSAPAGPRDIDVLGVGSLVSVKDFERFVDLLRGLSGRFPTLRVRLVGDGPGREGIERRAKDGGLVDHLRLEGALPRRDVLALMQRSRILLHTARYEGQGYVFLEALRCGAHVVCFDVGFAPVSDHVHRCRDMGEMEEVIERLLSRPLDHGPVEVPSIGATAEAYEAIYRRLRTESAVSKTFFESTSKFRKTSR